MLSEGNCCFRFVSYGYLRQKSIISFLQVDEWQRSDAQRLCHSSKSKSSISAFSVRESATLPIITSGGSFSFIEVVYVDEKEITHINQKHLSHDYVTDIITFSYHDPSENEPVEATLFCCAPRIQEQAVEFGVDADTEFLRVYIHGLLHLAGYSDELPDQKAVMREKENFYINHIKQPNAK